MEPYSWLKYQVFFGIILIYGIILYFNYNKICLCIVTICIGTVTITIKFGGNCIFNYLCIFCWAMVYCFCSYDAVRRFVDPSVYRVLLPDLEPEWFYVSAWILISESFKDLKDELFWNLITFKVNDPYIKIKVQKTYLLKMAPTILINFIV